MLKETRGFDFTGYKPSTLQRRIYRRMAALGLSTFGEYRDYLELQPEEFTELFNSMLINVTSFFRDPAAWQVLSGKVVPGLFQPRGHRRRYVSGVLDVPPVRRPTPWPRS